MSAHESFSRPLGGGLTLRAVAGADDVERVAAFDAQIHGAGTEPTWRAWMTEHPAARPDHWLYVEEDTTRRVVASLCLLSWRVQYEGVPLRSAEMGVVGTLEEYRGRGLQRALNQRFSEIVAEEGHELSHIQGIPYFYRQFGYEYAAPLEAWWCVEPYRIPAEGPPVFACRPATEQDLPVLNRLYQEAVPALGFGALRDAETWRYLLGPALGTETGAETWVVTGARGEAEGYVRVAHHGFGEGLIVSECSLLSFDAALAALSLFRRLAEERGKPFVRLSLPASSALVAAARAFGGRDEGTYAWQIRVPDVPRFFRAIAPALERRLAASPFAGLTRSLQIGLYRHGVRLRFAGGRLAEVSATPANGGDVRLPPQLLAPLVLGYRGFGELSAMFPDASADGVARELIGVLFPKMTAFLYQQY